MISFTISVGFLSLVVSLGIILGLYTLFLRLGNSRFLHFRRFFLLQAVAYAVAAVSVLTTDSTLLVIARVLTPVSYAYLWYGMTRRSEEVR